MNSSPIPLKYFTSWIILKSIPILHSCYPWSCSGSYVSLRCCSSSLTWPPGLLSTSIQIYSSCRDFSKLCLQRCQSSAQTLQLYIHHCQDEAHTCKQLTCRVSQPFPLVSHHSLSCFMLRQHWTARSSLHPHCLLPSPHYPYQSLSLEWSHPIFSPLTSLRHHLNSCPYPAAAESISLCVILILL